MALSKALNGFVPSRRRGSGAAVTVLPTPLAATFSTATS
jgi:hypothetical protein